MESSGRFRSAVILLTESELHVFLLFIQIRIDQTLVVVFLVPFVIYLNEINPAFFREIGKKSNEGRRSSNRHRTNGLL